MPQEIRVVQCFSCNIFQGDIVKKVSKWSCRVCGAKQSLKKVFETGTGKECRQLVQAMNTHNHSTIENKQQDLEMEENDCSNSDLIDGIYNENGQTVSISSYDAIKNSKWDEFIDDTAANNIAPILQTETVQTSYDKLNSQSIFETNEILEL